MNEAQAEPAYVSFDDMSFKLPVQDFAGQWQPAEWSYAPIPVFKVFLGAEVVGDALRRPNIFRVEVHPESMREPVTYPDGAVNFWSANIIRLLRPVKWDPATAHDFAVWCAHCAVDYLPPDDAQLIQEIADIVASAALPPQVAQALDSGDQTALVAAIHASRYISRDTARAALEELKRAPTRRDRLRIHIRYAVSMSYGVDPFFAAAGAAQHCALAIRCALGKGGSTAAARAPLYARWRELVGDVP